MSDQPSGPAAETSSGADQNTPVAAASDDAVRGPASMITGNCVIERAGPGLTFANLGEPIALDGLSMHGVAASAARADEKVEMWTRLAVTSDERIFHRIVDSLNKVIDGRAAAVGAHVGLDRAHSVILVIRPDDSGELWRDAAATSITGLVRRRLTAGSVVFDRDIADIGSMDFPLVAIGPEDRVVCLIREGWRFGLYFDFNPGGAFDRPLMTRELGRLLRTLRFSALYDVVSDDALFGRIVDLGWFPFVEIINRDFSTLTETLLNDFDLAEAEAEILDGFDRVRLERMFDRWMSRPHFAGKEKILRAALEHFLANEPIGAIKIALTEIEGVLQDAYVATSARARS
ncbi:hypothetical protein ACIKTA_05430 [Hansschlegelia beijingensis]